MSRPTRSSTPCDRPERRSATRGLCGARRPRRGLTLVEVAAGLALMAGLLVAMLTIKSRATHQLAVADRHLRGVAAADAMLSTWWADPSAFPVDRSGPVPSDPSLTWQTARVPDADPTAARFGVRTVRVQIRGADSADVLVSVDVLLPPVPKK